MCTCSSFWLSSIRLCKLFLVRHVSSMSDVDIMCFLESKNPLKPDKVVCSVKLDEAVNPVKLD